MNRIGMLLLLSVFWSTMGISQEKNPVWLKSELSGPKSYFICGKHIVVKSESYLQRFSSKGEFKGEIPLLDANKVVFSDDGALRGSLKKKGMHISWDNCRRELFLRMKNISDAKFSPNNEAVALISQNQILLFNLVSKKIIHSYALAEKTLFRIGAISRNGDKVILISGDKIVSIYEPNTNSWRELAVHPAQITHTIFSKNEEYVMSSSRDGTFIKVVLDGSSIQSQTMVTSAEIVGFIEVNGVIYSICSKGFLWAVDFESQTKKIVGAIPLPIGFSKNLNSKMVYRINSAKWPNLSRLLLIFENNEVLLFDLRKPWHMESFIFAEEWFVGSSFHLVKIALEPFLCPAMWSRL